MGTDGNSVFRVDSLEELDIEIDKSEEFKTKGNEYYGKKDYKKAIEYYTKSIQEDSTNHLVYCNRSAAYYMIGEYDNSFYDGKKSIELSEGQFYKAYVRVSKALFSLKRYMESYDFICKALLLDQDTTGEIKQHFDDLLEMRRKELLNSDNPTKVIPPQFPSLSEIPNSNTKQSSSSSSSPSSPPLTNISINNNATNNVKPSTTFASKSATTESTKPTTNEKPKEKSIKELEKEINSVGAQPKNKKNKKKQQHQAHQAQQSVSKPAATPKETIITSVSTKSNDEILVKGWRVIQNGGRIGHRYRSTGVEIGGDSILIWGGKNETDRASIFKMFHVGLDINSPIVYNTRKDIYYELNFKITTRINHSMVRVGERIYIIGGESASNSTKIVKSYATACIDLSDIKVGPQNIKLNEVDRPIDLHACNSTVVNSTIWVLNSNCIFHTFDTKSNTWGTVIDSTVNSRQVPPIRKHTFLTTISQRYIFMYGGSNGLITYKDMHCFDTQNREWMSLSHKGSIPSITVNNTLNSFSNSSFTNEGGVQYLVFFNDSNQLWALNTSTLCWREIPYIVPTPLPPSLEQFLQVIVDDNLYVVGGIGAKVDYVSQVSDDVFVFPIGEVLNSFNERQPTIESSPFEDITMPLWTCFTCGKLTQSSNTCNKNCKHQVLYCSSKCELKGLSKHKCNEHGSNDSGSGSNNKNLNAVRLEKELELLELKKRVCEDEIKSLLSTSSSPQQVDPLIEKEKKSINEIEERKQAIYRKFEDLDDDKLCPICMESGNNRAAVPCGHRFCLGCIKKLNNCPFCKKGISSFIKIY